MMSHQIIGYLDRKFSLCTDEAVLLYVELIGPEMIPKCLSSYCSFLFVCFFSLFLIFMSLLYWVLMSNNTYTCFNLISAALWLPVIYSTC